MHSGQPGEATGKALLAPAGRPLDTGASDAAVPPAAFALSVLDAIPQAGDTLVLAAGERRAEEIARALAALSDGGVEVLLLPGWDCLPYDRASPSREVMGRRMAVLQALAHPPERARILVVSPAALMQRLPADAGDTFTLVKGERLDRDAFAAFCAQAGYIVDDRVDEPGEVGLLGEVIDIFPAAADAPVRVDLDAADEILALRLYDPVTQRSDGEITRLVAPPASECLCEVERREGLEHRLPDADGALTTAMDRLESPAVVVEAGAPARCVRFAAQVEDAY